MVKMQLQYGFSETVWINNPYKHDQYVCIIVFIPTLVRRKIIMVFLFAHLYLFVTCLHVFHLSFNYTYDMEYIYYILYNIYMRMSVSKARYTV